MGIPASPNDAPFWIVWNPRGHLPPRYRHTTEMSALNEAARLASDHHGVEFFVLRAISRVHNPGLSIDHLVDAGSDDELPF